MGKLILMLGASGSGKSTHAWEIASAYQYTLGYIPMIHSNDDFFMRDGKYEWSSKLHEYAQRYCLSGVAKSCFDGEQVVIVDNTHTNLAAIQPYLHLADKIDYEVEIVEPNTYWRYSANDCFKKNTHKVPFDTIKAMIEKIQTLKKSGLIDKYLKVQDANTI